MTVWRMRIACWVTLDYKHTLRVCNTYCFSTQKMVAQTRLSITFIIACRIYFNISTFRSRCTKRNLAVCSSSFILCFRVMLHRLYYYYYYYYYYYKIWLSLVTGLFFLFRFQASHCNTFRIMCDAPTIAVFCSESIECFPGIVSKSFLKLLVTIPVAPIITGTIVHFRFHIRCISIHKFFLVWITNQLDVTFV